MSFSENTTTISINSNTPTSAAAAAAAFRRKSIEGDEENDPQRMFLPSPRREPLRVLHRNNNSKGSLSDGLPGSGKEKDVLPPASATAKPPLVAKAPNYRTPLKTPSSKQSSASRSSSAVLSPFAGRRTPNEGRILSPLPKQPRKLKTAKKKPVTIDMDEFLSKAPNMRSPTKDETFHGSDDGNTGCFARDGYGNGSGDEGTEADDHLLDLRISKTFDEDEAFDTSDQNDDEDEDEDSLGWAYTLDDFRFIRKLGAGGSADVYEVLEKTSKALYALKVQPATEEAMCEVDLHIPLRHENICQMIDYFYTDQKPFADCDPQTIDESQGQRSQGQTKAKYLCIMLEHCGHGDLHDLIDDHVAVPEDLAAKIILEAIRALQYLHSMNMVHCDIKPANWLVDGEDDEAVIKLADFGMAVTNDAREIVGGSPVYMAPEHLLAWRNLTGDFDHRTDIYSLGVVLYELLMGYLPYEVLEADDFRGHPSDETAAVDNSLAKEFLGLSVTDPLKDNCSEKCNSTETTSSEPLDYGYPVLDLRKLNDITAEQPFYIPPPIFVEDVSEEAQDLVLRLMEPSVSKRITLKEAQEHEWFRKVGV